MKIKAIEGKWISIEDELPEPFKTILMIYKTREIIAGFMDEPGDCGCGEICLYGGNIHKSLAFYEFSLIEIINERVELTGLEPMSVQFWMPFKNSIDEKILSIYPSLSVYLKEKV